MKVKTIHSLVITLCLLALAGCSSTQTPQQANELRFSLDGITALTISYDEENITFLEGEDNALVIKEYMTENKSSYYAKVSETSSSIQISEGDKPLLGGGFTRYVEVYLPANYSQSLTVTSTNGNVDFSGMDLSLSLLRVDNTSGKVTITNAEASEIYLSSTSGTLDLGAIEAAQIRLDTTSGTVRCDELDGSVAYTSTSGDIEVQSATGSGSYRASNSGQLVVVYTEVSGDLSFYNKNDDITLTLPADLAFTFEATTKNGSVSTNFSGSLAASGRTTSGVVGSNPTVTVKVETNDGNIVVEQ